MTHRQPRRARRRAVPRVPRRHASRPEVRAAGDRPRRARRAVRAGRRGGGACPESAIREIFVAPVPELSEHVGTDRGSLLRLAVAGARRGGHHRHERQDDLRVSARAGARALRPPAAYMRHDRLRHARGARRESAHTTVRCGERASQLDELRAGWARATCAWKCPRTRSTRARRRACASTPPCSPISRATISITTARWNSYGAAKALLFARAGARVARHQCR